MAWLIGHSPTERLQLQREIAALYRLRSRIVHRGRAGADVRNDRDRAVELGAESLKALLEKHPDLVTDENRGRVLILSGDAREPNGA